jgi:hypothetical protein
MSLWSAAAALGFGGLLAITAAIQPIPWSKLRGWVKSRDPCYYVPTWTFFAPNPGVKDVRLLWREQLVDGNVGPWHEIAAPRCGLPRALWNPAKRARKVVFDCRRRLAHAREREQDELFMLSVSYLLILHYVVGLPASPLSAARQFALVETQGADDDDGLLELLFASPWHHLPGASRDLELGTSKPPELVGSAA